MNRFQTLLSTATCATTLRLAVMPSRIENSPYTVYECAELGIPFIAANVGGVPDLIHTEDHEEALFEPTVEVLAARMGRALAHGVRPARPRWGGAASPQLDPSSTPG